MKRAYLLIEGQTEETFVRELMRPHYERMDLYLTPIIASTSSGHKGGVVTYAKVRREIEHLCKQDAGAMVSTMFDLYALPNDFPGKNSPQWSRLRSGSEKAVLIEQAMEHDILQRNFIPYIQVHEFEALLFVQPECFLDWADKSVTQQLAAARQTHAPEEINDDPRTAPSKRILAAMPSYQKPIHGPLIACAIGLDAMRTVCPHFALWLNKLDALAKQGNQTP
jgi:hypothetical protein